jgi:4-hydroxy-tetrahydrodipicolinate synthase
MGAHAEAMLYVPLITPFTASGSVDLDALSSLASSLLSDGATGLVALGTTGEPSSLSPSERAAVLSVVAEVCASRRAPLLVGANSAAELAALRDRPEVCGALTLVPPFVRPGPEGVLAYFTQLASPVPLVVYHVPLRTGQDLPPSYVERLAALPNVVAMKYAPGVLSTDSVEVFASAPSSFDVYCGDDALLAPMLALGARGAIAASAHVATGSYASFIASGDVPLGLSLGRLSAALFVEPNPTVIKGVLHAQGRIATPSVRIPLLPASSSTVEAALALVPPVPTPAVPTPAVPTPAVPTPEGALRVEGALR